MAASAIGEMIAVGLTSALGSKIAIGMIGLLGFIVLGVVMRLSIEGFLIVGLPLLLILSANGVGFLPSSIYYSILIICGVLIFSAVMSVIRK